MNYYERDKVYKVQLTNSEALEVFKNKLLDQGFHFFIFPDNTVKYFRIPRGYKITFQPKPVPARIAPDWDWSHEDYDLDSFEMAGEETTLKKAVTAIWDSFDYHNEES